MTIKSSVPESWAIEAKSLGKTYGDLKAVDSIDFRVATGECFGFLGPNGAGKSSTIKMLQCFAPVTEGTLSVLDMDVGKYAAQIKARLGVVPQEDMLDPDLKVRQNLTVYARYYNIPKLEREKRADKMLEFMQLTEKKDEKVDTLSGGMKRRLSIARALMNDPELLILDEPTTGLDPQARLMIWNQLNVLSRKGTTIVLTTHYMDEAARLCDRLVIMDEGHIVEQGKPSELIATHAGKHVIELPLDGHKPENILKSLPSGNWNFETHEDRLYLYCSDDHPPLKIFDEIGIKDYILRPASLEDVFLKLTGRELIE